MSTWKEDDELPLPAYYSNRSLESEQPDNAAPQVRQITEHDSSGRATSPAVAAPSSPSDKLERMCKERGTDEAWDMVVAELHQAYGGSSWLGKSGMTGAECAVAAIRSLWSATAPQEKLGRAFDQALAECTGSILSQYSANMIRKRANEIVATDRTSDAPSE